MYWNNDQKYSNCLETPKVLTVVPWGFNGGIVQQYILEFESVVHDYLSSLMQIELPFDGLKGDNCNIRIVWKFHKDKHN